MTRKMTLGALGSALAMAGVLAFSGQAVADQVTATLDNINPTQNGGGLFRFEDTIAPTYFNTFGTDQFVSFCIDLGDEIAKGDTVTWDIVSLSAAPDPAGDNMGVTRATQISQLLGAQIGADLNQARNLGDNVLKAIQLSLWEIIYETSDNPTGYDIAGGDFTRGPTSGAIYDLTVAMLAELDGYSGVVMGGLRGLTNATSQDMIAQVVPIPAAAWLFGSALLGMAGIGYRRRRTA